MSTTIPLTYRVDYEIGREAEDLTPIQIQENQRNNQSSTAAVCFTYFDKRPSANRTIRVSIT
jgi:hypothetical protein